MHLGRKNYLKIDLSTIKCAKRRRRVKWFGHLYHATPKWFDKVKAQAHYDERDRLNKRDGAGTWEVDHIVPLHNPLVSGLHVDYNMQVIASRANAAKSNHAWPDMPGGNLDMWGPDIHLPEWFNKPQREFKF